MDVEPRIAVMQDLRLQSFDLIRFASYRTASKLRYIQKSTNRKLDLHSDDQMIPKPTSLIRSALGRHMECDRGVSGERPQHSRAAE